jgi:hypothetical protein
VKVKHLAMIFSWFISHMWHYAVRPHLWVAPENVGLQKEQKCSTFACHTCNEVRLCVLGIRKKGSWQHEKIR